MKDPIVDEVRKYRMEHTQQCGGDLHKICEGLRGFEATLGGRVVTLPPQKIRPSRKSSHSS